MKRIALYARVSKALEQNPENQLIELRRWAAASGHEVAGEFVDEISSRDTRPQKEAVLKLIRQRKLDGVAFWSLDRWGRSMSELVLEIEEFSQKEYLMFSYKESLDLTTAAGRTFAFNMASFANYERERIRERTLLGLARARAQGKKLGRPPKNGKIYRRPSRAEVQQFADKGMSIRTIASELKTSKYWVHTVLKELKSLGVSVKVVE